MAPPLPGTLYRYGALPLKQVAGRSTRPPAAIRRPGVEVARPVENQEDPGRYRGAAPLRNPWAVGGRGSRLPRKQVQAGAMPARSTLYSPGALPRQDRSRAVTPVPSGWEVQVLTRPPGGPRPTGRPRAFEAREDGSTPSAPARLHAAVVEEQDASLPGKRPRVRNPPAAPRARSSTAEPAVDNRQTEVRLLPGAPRNRGRSVTVRHGWPWPTQTRRDSGRPLPAGVGQRKSAVPVRPKRGFDPRHRLQKFPCVGQPQAASLIRRKRRCDPGRRDPEGLDMQQVHPPRKRTGSSRGLGGATPPPSSTEETRIASWPHPVANRAARARGRCGGSTHLFRQILRGWEGGAPPRPHAPGIRVRLPDPLPGRVAQSGRWEPAKLPIAGAIPASASINLRRCRPGAGFLSRKQETAVRIGSPAPDRDQLKGQAAGLLIRSWWSESTSRCHPTLGEPPWGSRRPASFYLAGPGATPGGGPTLPSSNPARTPSPQGGNEGFESPRERHNPADRPARL